MYWHRVFSIARTSVSCYYPVSSDCVYAWNPISDWHQITNGKVQPHLPRSLHDLYAYGGRGKSYLAYAFYWEVFLYIWSAPKANCLGCDIFGAGNNILQPKISVKRRCLLISCLLQIGHHPRIYNLSRRFVWGAGQVEWNTTQTPCFTQLRDVIRMLHVWHFATKKYCCVFIIVIWCSYTPLDLEECLSAYKTDQDESLIIMFKHDLNR